LLHAERKLIVARKGVDIAPCSPS